MNAARFTQEDLDASKAIADRIPGWSGAMHYLFFKILLAAHPEIRRLLMLGVYHGRDIAFILDILARHHPGRQMNIVGVDKFNAEPCADWPAEKRGMTWERAFGCPPPDVESARRNTAAPWVAIVKEDDEGFLARMAILRTQFDCAYLDTDHTEATVARQIAQVSGIVPHGIICGDDYSDAGTWGVKRAVTAAFTAHEVFANWIWLAPVANLKQTTVTT